MALEPTGERMIAEDYMSSVEDYVIYLMHMASYDWAEPYVRGKRVLDFGCGSGLGSHLMSGRAHSVEAVDVARDAVEYASQRYSGSNIRFSQILPAAPLPFDDRSFDVVTSFQVIEHVTDREAYLREALRVLVPGGRLLLITPNRSYRLFPGQRPWNRWHVTEFSEGQLRRLLASVFPEVQMLAMSGRKNVVDIEIRRARLLKWLTLPFTVPFYPDSLRLRFLNLLHARRPARKGAKQDFEFDQSAIRIGPDVGPSLNLVAVVRRN